MNHTQHVVLNVPDVSCNHCKMAIEGAVGAVAGVEAVTVAVDAKSVDVRLDPDVTSVEAVRAAIVDEGYTVAGDHVFVE